MKFNTGSWVKSNTGETANIVIDSKALSLKEIGIGFGLILSGALYLVFRSFKNGAYAFEAGEYEALKSLDLLEPIPGGDKS